MSNERLNGLVLIAIEKEIALPLNLNDLVLEFPKCQIEIYN